MHPLPVVDKAMRALVVEGKRYVLPETAARELTAELAAKTGHPDLPATVAELCVLAMWLAAERNSPEARDALLAVAKTALPEVQAQVAARPAISERVSQADLARVTGALAKKHVARAAPAGTPRPRSGSKRRSPSSCPSIRATAANPCQSRS